MFIKFFCCFIVALDENPVVFVFVFGCNMENIACDVPKRFIGAVILQIIGKFRIVYIGRKLIHVSDKDPVLCPHCRNEKFLKCSFGGFVNN